MKDALGRSLVEGEYVLTTRPGYRSLVEGKVKRVTPKGATIEWKDTWLRNQDRETFRSSDQIAKAWP